MKIFTISAFFLSTLPFLALGNQDDTRKISWKGIQTYPLSEKETVSLLAFEGASYDNAIHSLPKYYEKIRINSSAFEVAITDTEFQPFTEEELKIFKQYNYSVAEEIQVQSNTLYDRKIPHAVISFVPIRKNTVSGKPEKLVSFRLVLKEVPGALRLHTASRTYALNSVLEKGTWYKMGVIRDGIHKLGSSDFKKMGIDVAAVDPRNIRIFGNGGGMLPLQNSVPRTDDLQENAIYVKGEADGKFDSSDYILFYGQSPHRWYYNPSDGRFNHSIHQYSDTTYYFICADRTDMGTPKRISSVSSSGLTPTHTVSSFDDFQYHEQDMVNLIKSGRAWMGEYFDIQTSHSFSFFFPNIDVSSPVYLRAELAARNAQNSTFTVTTPNGSFPVVVPWVSVDCYYCPYAAMGSETYTFTPVSSSIPVQVSKVTSSAIGWMNFLELNARRKLIMDKDQMTFRDALSVGPGNVALFDLQSASPVTVWDVSDPANAGSIVFPGNNYQFTLPVPVRREFIAFTGASYFSPSFHGQVPNQNLHKYAAEHPDMVIVSHPLFLSEANALADFHTSHDNLRTIVVTPQQIYNEFSSGAQDVAAIRDFMKMLYDNASVAAELPDYLLLYGDGSYVNKIHYPSNTNFIVSYQSRESFSYTTSYVSDDFFGMMDNAEGDWDSSPGIVDIGVGRITVKSTAESKAALDKIFKYNSTHVSFKNPCPSCNEQSGCSAYGEWRNVVCFVADDEDIALHFQQAQSLTAMIQNNYPDYNIDKIYLDAYIQQVTPGGGRYPEANADLNKRVEKGALIINYTGHGGELGLTHERVVEISDINNWKNICNMPLFFTATCEFSRWDDPERTSAGEYVFLNPNGGGIALMTTVRLVFAGPNFTLNQSFYNYAFKEINGEMPRLGDIMRLTKGALSAFEINHRNFTLLGDPALKLSYPMHRVFTDSINADSARTASYDTLGALAMVTIGGYIADKNGNLLSDRNGILYPTVFDKPATITLLSNDDPLNSSLKHPFNLQKNVIYKGKTGVQNGRFKFSFIVPKDIAYQFGKGKISYYYMDSVSGKGDAHGAYERIIVGGSAANPVQDVTGPDIKLYMNDEKFVSGGTTDENPELYAILSDSTGINVMGNGIGHDISAVLDENTKNAISLNDYFEADLNSYQSGVLRYPFSDLSEGTHSVKLKVWDVNNNSSMASAEFIVAKSAKLALEHVLNYPNPFTSRTKFFFEHNQSCDEMNVQIQVFTVSGKLVKTINTFVYSKGYRADPVEWDGRDDYGDKIGKGVYVYRIKVKNSTGEMAEKFEKLVILN